MEITIVFILIVVFIVVAEVISFREKKRFDNVLRMHLKEKSLRKKTRKKRKLKQLLVSDLLQRDTKPHSAE